MSEKGVNIYVVSHVHWDREWYMTYEQFRMRLVEVIDRLLDHFDADPEFKHFHFDGQTIFLEDYLEIRPENAERLRAAIESGRISIGPWYVLPDGFCTCSENLIRNLLMGDEICKRYHVNPQIAYLPDTFGHSSQIPQILRGFSFDYALVWRGISGEELKTEFMWVSPDGTEIPTIHLLDDCGYLNFRYFPRENSEEAVNEAVERYLESSTTDNVLLMNGFDHQMPQLHVGKEIKRLSAKMKIHHAKLQDYVDAVFEEEPKLERVYGELTEVNSNPRAKFNTLLRNCLSSRNDIKVKNFNVVELLLRYSEPLMAMAFMHGEKYWEAFIHQAWKYVLQNDAHDSICGCSVNGVNRDISVRLDWAAEIGEQCCREAMHSMVKHVELPECFADYMPIYIFNTLPYSREGVTEVEFEIEQGKYFKDVVVVNAEGKSLPVQVLDIQDKGMVDNIASEEIGWHACRMIRIAVDVRVPAFGYTVIYAKAVDLPRRICSENLSSAFGILENDFIRAEIQPNGTLRINDKRTGACMEDVNYFQDGGDVGDLYIYSPPHQDAVSTTLYHKPKIQLVENGTLKTVYAITYEWELPETFSELCAAENRVVNRISSYVTLYRHEDILRFRTVVENHAKQHRLRVCFPTDCRDETILADSHFDVVKRPIRGNDVPDESLIERPYNCNAQKRFLVYGNLLLLNRGLQEYEVTQHTKGNQVEVTLLRCVQKIGQSNTLSTVVMPGPYCIESTDGQCIGTYTFEYAAGFADEQVNHRAELFLTPCTSIYGKHESGDRIPQDTGLEIENRNVRVSSIKKAIADDSLILRFYNPREVSETVKIKGKFDETEIVNLREETEKSLPCREGRLEITAEPKKIITLKLKKKKK